MPRLSPFAALRYASDAGDPAELIAPPYDVIGVPHADELRRRSPYNAVHLVLPEGDGEERYAAAAARVADWRRTGILAEDAAPAVYAYRQRYEANGREVERLALFGALALEPLGDGILPHERTHAGPKADRLALTLATRTQLSPVFLLARDPDASLLEALRALADRSPLLESRTPDGIEHALWAIENEDAAADLCAVAGRHRMLIADGHHRYETAMEVARRLRSDAADHVLACVVSAEDPGLVIRPTHRTLTGIEGLAPDELRVRLEKWFDVMRLGDIDPRQAEIEAAADPAGLVLLMPSGGANGSAAAGATVPGWLLSPRTSSRTVPSSPAMAGGTVAAGAEATAERAAERLAAVQFDRHVIRGLLGSDADAAAQQGLLEYHRDAGEAVRRAGPAGAAFILPAVGLDAVWAATAGGIRLPPKSTYFEPKIPSGLLFRPL